MRKKRYSKKSRRSYSPHDLARAYAERSERRRRYHYEDRLIYSIFFKRLFTFCTIAVASMPAQDNSSSGVPDIGNADTAKPLYANNLIAQRCCYRFTDTALGIMIFNSNDGIMCSVCNL